MLDLNRTTTKAKAANETINGLIDQAQSLSSVETPRDYLGASAIGHDCLRKILWDWRSPAPITPRTRRIFDRGNWFESYARSLLVRAGFRFDVLAPAFSQLEGKFKGHGDGKIVAGPDIALYPCLWEAKGLGAKGWTKLQKDGLAKTYPNYADQVSIYQAYFGLADNPALFTAANMDTMELLHLMVPFDAQRAQAASDRAVAIVAADVGNEILPRVTDNQDDWRCRFCNHKTKCWGP